MKMKINFILILISTLIGGLQGKGNITATGGGIVKPGVNLVLRYEVESNWDRCYWFLYEHSADYEYCIFDMDPNGSVKLHKCKPESLSNEIEYSGTALTECAITVKNVTDRYNVTWAARMGDEMDVTKIDIIVASPIENATTRIPQDLVVNSPGKIECHVNGGRPAPQLLMQIGPNNSTPEIVNNTMSQTPDTEGLYTTHQDIYILPNITDHGKEVTCRAAVLDANEKLIFDWVNAEPIFMNVTFAPQSLPNQSLTGYLHKEISVSFEFKSNPAPTELKWIVSSPGEDQNQTKSRSLLKKEKSNLELLPGHVDSKYKVSMVNATSNVTFQSMLTIFNLNHQDEGLSYHLEVRNSLGAQDYFFNITVEDKEPITTTSTTAQPTTTSETLPTSTTSGPPETEGRSHTAFYVILVLVIALGLGACCLVVYRKKIKNNETVPLTR